VGKKEIIANTDRAGVGMIAAEHGIQVSCSAARGLRIQKETATSVHDSECKAGSQCISAKTSARELHRFPSRHRLMSQL
jgi:hypothetical protein